MSAPGGEVPGGPVGPEPTPSPAPDPANRFIAYIYRLRSLAGRVGPHADDRSPGAEWGYTTDPGADPFADVTGTVEGTSGDGAPAGAATPSNEELSAVIPEEKGLLGFGLWAQLVNVAWDVLAGKESQEDYAASARNLGISEHDASSLLVRVHRLWQAKSGEPGSTRTVVLGSGGAAEPRPDGDEAGTLPVAGITARTVVAGLRMLYKCKNGELVLDRNGNPIPRKLLVASVGLGLMAVAFAVKAPEIIHAAEAFGHGAQGAVDGLAEFLAGNSSAAKHAGHGGAAVSTLAPTPGSGSQGTLPNTPPPPATSAPSPTQAVTIGAHKNSVWGELHAERPDLTNAQIAGAIDNTEQLTGQNLNHVYKGEVVNLVFPQSGSGGAGEQATALHARTLQGGRVEPIAQPAGSSVVRLQADASHNSLGDVVAQTLRANHLAAPPGEFNDLVTGLIRYNHMENVNEHSLPIGWPVYVPALPPQEIMRYLLDEAA